MRTGRLWNIAIYAYSPKIRLLYPEVIESFIRHPCTVAFCIKRIFINAFNQYNYIFTKKIDIFIVKN